MLFIKNNNTQSYAFTHLLVYEQWKTINYTAAAYHSEIENDLLHSVPIKWIVENFQSKKWMNEVETKVKLKLPHLVAMSEYECRFLWPHFGMLNSFSSAIIIEWPSIHGMKWYGTANANFIEMFRIDAIVWIWSHEYHFIGRTYRHRGVCTSYWLCIRINSTQNVCFFFLLWPFHMGRILFTCTQVERCAAVCADYCCYNLFVCFRLNSKAIIIWQRAETVRKRTIHVDLMQNLNSQTAGQ